MNDVHSATRSRKPLRLPDYDYGQVGGYFITLCCEGRTCLFGSVVNGVMHLNAAGECVDHWWNEISNKYPSVALDSYVIMPNHVHGILLFVGADLCVRPDASNPHAGLPIRTMPSGLGAHAGAPLQNPGLGDVIKWFKTMTTNAYIRGVHDQGWVRFAGKLWQRNFYDHIIRDVSDADRIRTYIASNPAAWLDDENHPLRLS